MSWLGVLAVTHRHVNDKFSVLKETKMKKSSFIITLFLLVLTLTPALAQAPEGEEYIVQADDWLSKIAEKAYGDVLAYPAIVEATNAKAAEDNSFAVIANPALIKVDQKL
jgi:hypothetical protein